MTRKLSIVRSQSSADDEVRLAHERTKQMLKDVSADFERELAGGRRGGDEEFDEDEPDA